MYIKLKRDLISIYFLLFFVKYYIKGQYASCLEQVARIEFLESNISTVVSKLLWAILKKKYDAAAIIKKRDPFVNKVLSRFSQHGQKNFLASNIIVLKPYLNVQEKGVILLNYTEIINAFPFLFDLKKIQDHYDLVLEPSAESPYQMYYKLYHNSSNVFVQALSRREIKADITHGFIDVPVSAGDWIHEGKFSRKETSDIKYDFCVIANFKPVKRYDFLFSALSKYWQGNLNFALIASSHAGEKREWAEQMMASYKVPGNADIFMDVPADKVSEVINQSRCHVLCSVREGANRANFESLFAGTPVVVYKHHIGFPNFRFDDSMVVKYTDERSLVAAIKKCVFINKNELAEKTSKMIGSANATRILNERIRNASLTSNTVWTRDIFRKVNIVQSYYYYPQDCDDCIKDYEYIKNASLREDIYDEEYAIKRFREAYI